MMKNPRIQGNPFLKGLTGLNDWTTFGENGWLIVQAMAYVPMLYATDINTDDNKLDSKVCEAPRGR